MQADPARIRRPTGRRVGSCAPAAATCATCLERDPEWMMAAIRRGRCLVQLGRFEEARASLELGADLAVRQGHEEPFEEIREERISIYGKAPVGA